MIIYQSGLDLVADMISKGQREVTVGVLWVQ